MDSFSLLVEAAPPPPCGTRDRSVASSKLFVRNAEPLKCTIVHTYSFTYRVRGNFLGLCVGYDVLDGLHPTILYASHGRPTHMVLPEGSRP